MNVGIAGRKVVSYLFPTSRQEFKAVLTGRELRKNLQAIPSGLISPCFMPVNLHIQAMSVFEKPGGTPSIMPSHISGKSLPQIQTEVNITKEREVSAVFNRHLKSQAPKTKGIRIAAKIVTGTIGAMAAGVIVLLGLAFEAITLSAVVSGLALFMSIALISFSLFFLAGRSVRRIKNDVRAICTDSEKQRILENLWLEQPARLQRSFLRFMPKENRKAFTPRHLSPGRKVLIGTLKWGSCVAGAGILSSVFLATPFVWGINLSMVPLSTLSFGLGALLVFGLSRLVKYLPTFYSRMQANKLRKRVLASQAYRHEADLLSRRRELKDNIDEKKGFEKQLAFLKNRLKESKGGEKIRLLHEQNTLCSRIAYLDDNIFELEGKLVAEYSIGHVMLKGEGGMGIVYIGYSAGLDKGVVVKTISRTGLSEAQYKGLLIRLEKEAEVQAKINHPNVVRIYTFREVAGEPAIIQELINGKDLYDIPKGYAVFRKEKQVYINIMLQIAKGLKAAHDNDVIHRDLKSQNVLVTWDESGRISRVAIIDFGLGRDLLASGKRVTLDTFGSVGTPGYMSPEQWKGLKGVGKPTDIYALGCIFFELISGRIPYEDNLPDGADSQQQINHFKTATLNEPVPVLADEDFQNLIARMMQKDPLKRPNIDFVILQLQKISLAAANLPVIVSLSRG